MTKRIILTLLIFGIPLTLAAQSIELPELTTEVDGAEIVAEEDSLPDFSFVVNIPSASEDILPELPEVSISEKKWAAKNSAKEHSSIYADGLIGGGYPGLFKGQFSIYSQEENAFKLDFNHDSAYGYSNQNLLSGYKDSETSIGIEKKLSLGQFSFLFTGDYVNMSNGLQAKSQSFSGVNQNNLEGTVGGVWQSSPTFKVGTDVYMAYYNRYADAITFDAYNVANWIAKASIFGISPDLYLKWEDFGFNAGLSGKYSFDLDAGHYYTFDKTNNRGEFTLDFGWKNNFINLFGNVGLVFGNQMNLNTVIVPFTVGFDWSFASYFSSRNFSMSLRGGLESKKTSIAEQEVVHKFAGFSGIPTEQSDWFGKMEILVPLKSAFTAKASAEFRKTAFGNGVWDADYSLLSFNDGIYQFKQFDRQLLKTELSLSYHYKIFSVAGKWQSNWMYVPSNEYAQLVSLTIGFQSENSIWGVDSTISIPAGSVQDYSPIIDFNAFVGVTSSVRIVVSTSDVVKLFSGTIRQYAGIYAGRSGNASLLIKFFF